MLTNNAANMKWVEHQKRDNTSAVTKQSVVNLISWVNSNAQNLSKQGRKLGHVLQSCTLCHQKP